MDVGANVGKYTLESARAVGKFGFVVAVEPDVKNYSCLLKALNVNGFSNVYSIRSVAGDFNGYLKLFSGVHSGGHNIICDHVKARLRLNV